MTGAGSSIQELRRQAERLGVLPADAGLEQVHGFLAELAAPTVPVTAPPLGDEAVGLDGAPIVYRPALIPAP